VKHLSYILGLVVLTMVATTSFASILIDESAPVGNRYKRSRDLETDLKAKKKVGVSSTVAGAFGLFGVGIDLNFTRDVAFSIGAGLSQNFSAFNMNMKFALSDGSFQPYFVGGISRWSANGSNGEITHSTPGFLESKFLSDSERRSGKFAKNIIYPGLGLQYLNTSGDLEGLGYFAEVLMMMEISSLAVAPTGGVGAIYYF